MDTLSQLYNDTQTLCVFKKAVNNSAIAKLITALSGKNVADNLTDYACALYSSTQSGNSVKYFKKILMADENAFSSGAAMHKKIAPQIFSAAENELQILNRLAQLTNFCFNVPQNFPAFGGKGNLFSAMQLQKQIMQNGYGEIALSCVYTWQDGNIKAVTDYSNITLDSLKDYATEKAAVVENTEFFVKGLPANNVLLYGDRGTGKSSTIAALVNAYKNSGLRLLEIGKKDIESFPKIIATLSKFALKFIIFLDDLTFKGGEDDFATLKAALEGGVSQCNNTLIYATSNRRHLINESASDRAGNDMHVADTMEEQLSLSDRFGLVVTYVNPNKREFVNILSQILADRNIVLPQNQLETLAEQFALSKGGRSPRAAKQLADIIESRISQNTI